MLKTKYRKKYNVKPLILFYFISLIFILLVFVYTKCNASVENSGTTSSTAIFQSHHKDFHMLDNEEESIDKSSILKNDKFYFDIPLDTKIQDYMFRVCKYFNVQPELMVALIEHESGFTINAISATNDYGLCQINKCNHEWLSKRFGINDILNPYQNILAGTYILSIYLNEYNLSLNDALMCYNMGFGGASELWAEGIHNTKYSKGVIEKYNKYINEVK